MDCWRFREDGWKALESASRLWFPAAQPRTVCRLRNRESGKSRCSAPDAYSNKDVCGVSGKLSRIRLSILDSRSQETLGS